LDPPPSIFHDISDHDAVITLAEVVFVRLKGLICKWFDIQAVAKGYPDQKVFKSSHFIVKTSFFVVLNFLCAANVFLQSLIGSFLHNINFSLFFFESTISRLQSSRICLVRDNRRRYYFIFDLRIGFTKELSGRKVFLGNEIMWCAAVIFLIIDRFKIYIGIIGELISPT